MLNNNWIKIFVRRIFWIRVIHAIRFAKRANKFSAFAQIRRRQCMWHLLCIEQWWRRRRQASTMAIICIYMLVDLRVVNSRFELNTDYTYLHSYMVWLHTWDFFVWCTGADIRACQVARLSPNTHTHARAKSFSVSWFYSSHVEHSAHCVSLVCIVFCVNVRTSRHISEESDSAICILLAENSRKSVEIIFVCIAELWIRLWIAHWVLQWDEWANSTELALWTIGVNVVRPIGNSGWISIRVCQLMRVCLFVFQHTNS